MFHLYQPVRIVKAFPEREDMVGKECILTGIVENITNDKGAKEKGWTTSLKHPTWPGPYCVTEYQIEPANHDPDFAKEEQENVIEELEYAFTKTEKEIRKHVKVRSW